MILSPNFDKFVFYNIFVQEGSHENEDGWLAIQNYSGQAQAIQKNQSCNFQPIHGYFSVALNNFHEYT